MERRALLGLVASGLAATAGCIGERGSPAGRATDEALAVDSVTVRPAESSAPGHVTLDATVVRERITPTTPGQVRFAVRNAGEDPVELASGPVPPFGVLEATSTDGSGEFVLWNDRYRESSNVRVENGTVESVADVGRRYRLEPGTTVESTYEIRYEPDAVVPGRYRVTDVSGLGLQFGSVSYAVTIEIVSATTG